MCRKPKKHKGKISNKTKNAEQEKTTTEQGVLRIGF